MKGWTLAIALSLGLLPALAQAGWWNNDWKYRKELQLDLSSGGADIAGSVQDVPVLVRLSLGNFSYFNDTKPDGSDFRFVAADDKTPLKFHIEKYDPQNQMALIWVRVPQLTGGGKTDKIYAYYGNPSAPGAADEPGTYDVSQALVLSFLQPEGLPLDSSAYHNNATGSDASFTSASLIGGGVKFNGKGSLSVPASASLRLLPNQGITLSTWLRLDGAQQSTVLALADQGKLISLDVEGTKLSARASFGGAPVTVSQTSDLSSAQWHHAAIVIGGGKLTLYVDGLPVGSANVTAQEIGGTLSIGGLNKARFFVGDMDEVQASKISRSADWIKAAARGQGIDGNLLIYGTDGQREGSSQSSYFVTIAKNLTVDGWVVIGICMLMLVVALIIMFVKAIFLSRVEKANNRFLRDFRRLSGDATALDKPGDVEEDLDEVPSMSSLAGDQNKYGASTLYRLYHHGVRELHKRIGAQTLSAAQVESLSSQSIDAIRAALDASMTRLQQSLSSQMVMLTIAISGGPFLGLLGTVIGVMITFAAIALSGDVNINAIAPGTAAALAATVAGLAVAIPSLFGYNWLNTRIRAISADNRVFVDEFVTRLAEQYR